MVGGKGELKGVLYGDLWRLNQYPINYFGNCLELGANHGATAIVLACRYPGAKLVVLEPAPDTVSYLKQNLTGFAVTIMQLAIGDGEPTTIDMNTHNIARRTGVGEEPVKTIKFDALIEACNFDFNKKSLLVCDIEGGEAYLRGYEDILRKFDHLSFEVHFTPLVPGVLWESINSWFNSTFSGYDIAYYCSSRRVGHGHYTVIKRQK
jgi:FkbM family methyltransferase